ncbi:unnamed protein product [Chondrus crispus]|uniref:DDE Tnp4 domain-containing protein n=1 Tax=Chondrus crispus TaxID=2769 RepID=R7QKF3_CHOCR|nr:unnamed protein product [Chondrus crispus]CDF38544.1 unnamed protein product [Chondrus crispus]|eukprot:XP_005718437.1 unnamed protein product [Chondrus crispus]
MEFLDPFEDDVVVVCIAEQTRAAGAAVSAVAGNSGGALVSSAAGSGIGRMPNVDRAFEEAWKRLQDYYLGSNRRYSEKTFARRFRMSQSTFDTIYNAVSSRGEFQRKPNALGELGLFPVQRMVAALRMLAYGTAADAVDEYLRISESSALLSLQLFCNAVCEEFGEEYARQPNADDLTRILAINERRGFPGCLGSIDCQRRRWERCPVAFAGQFTRKEKKPTVVLEAICDRELWIWHAFFGCPGSLNDLNVLNMSSTMASVLEGKHPPRFSFVVDGTTYNTPYYFADGIYPSWAMFIKTLRKSSSPEAKRFSAAQEAVRKDIERAFGVLVARFHILKAPCLLRDRTTMASVMRACIIMHNMVVESRRDDYESGHYNASASFEFGISTNLAAFHAWANTVEKRLNEFTSRTGHSALRQSLIRHIWSRFGAGNG